MSEIDGPGADRLPTTVAAFNEGVAAGWHHGGQIFVSLAGETVADLGLGRRRRDEPLDRDAQMIWLSATKPVAAVAIAQLWERGLLELDDPVARHVPEFAARGKGGITLRHVLTHTSGFRLLNLPWPAASWEEILERICSARPEPRWIPGHKAGYHMQASWFVLGEILRRLDGRPFERYVREEIFEPLAMDDCWIGMPPEVFRRDPHRVAPIYDTEASSSTGVSPRDDGEGTATGFEPGWRPFPWHREDRVTGVNPGANGVGPVAQLARLYRMLLGRGSLDGRRVLLPQTVEALTAPHRVGMYDHTFKAPLDWGLGLIVNSEHYFAAAETTEAGAEDGSVSAEGEARMPYGYGRLASRRTFGHSGRRTSTAFADPEHDLVVALAVNGSPGEEEHRARTQALTEAIYRDLGLG